MDCDRGRHIALFSRAATPTLAQDGAKQAETESKLPGQIFVQGREQRGNDIATLAFNPNDRTWTQVPKSLPFARVSPDGRHIVYASMPRGPKRLRAIEVIDSEGEQPAIPILELVTSKVRTPPFWSFDGKSVYVVEAGSDTPSFITWKFAADGSHPTKLSLPNTEQVEDISPDGQWFVTLSSRPSSPESKELSFPPRAVYLVHADGTGERRLIKLAEDAKAPISTRGFRFSSDGRAIAYLVQKRDGGIMSGSLCLVDVDGKNRRCIRDGTAERFPLAASWSPDGKRLAVSVWERPADAKPGRVNLFAGTMTVEIIDREGRTERTLELPPAQQYLVLDWR